MTTLPFMYDQLAAQRETIRTLQAQAKLSHKLVRIERYVHAFKLLSPPCTYISGSAHTYRQVKDVLKPQRSTRSREAIMAHHPRRTRSTARV